MLMMRRVMMRIFVDGEEKDDDGDVDADDGNGDDDFKIHWKAVQKWMRVRTER